MQLKFDTLDVFTSQRFDGNPLAVVHDADALTTEQMNVKRSREKAGLTQEQLAESSGLSQQYISGLEGGRRNPTVVTVYELATALGVSHLDLLRPRNKS